MSRLWASKRHANPMEVGARKIQSETLQHTKTNVSANFNSQICFSSTKAAQCTLGCHNMSHMFGFDWRKMPPEQIGYAINLELPMSLPPQGAVHGIDHLKTGSQQAEFKKTAASIPQVVFLRSKREKLASYSPTSTIDTIQLRSNSISVGSGLGRMDPLLVASSNFKPETHCFWLQTISRTLALPFIQVLRSEQRASQPQPCKIIPSQTMELAAKVEALSSANTGWHLEIWGLLLHLAIQMRPASAQERTTQVLEIGPWTHSILAGLEMIIPTIQPCLRCTRRSSN